MPKGFTLWTPPGGNDFCPLLISLRSIKSPLEVFCDCRPANLIDPEPKAFSRQSSPQSQKIFCSHHNQSRGNGNGFWADFSRKISFAKKSLPVYINPSDCGIRISVPLDFVTSQPHHILRYGTPIALCLSACECASLLECNTPHIR